MDAEYDLNFSDRSPINQKDCERERPFIWMEQSRDYQRIIVRQMIEKARAQTISNSDWILKSNKINKSWWLERYEISKAVYERLQKYLQYLKNKS